MSDQYAEFQSRLRRLDRKTLNKGHGYTAKIRTDGLIVVEPRKVVRSRISLRSLLLFLAAGLLFKGFLMASLGFASYDQRVSQLAEGSFVERSGAFVMQSDPLSRKIAGQLLPLLR